MINEYAIASMKNRSNDYKYQVVDHLIDTDAVIAGLKKEKVGYLGLDVYEEEEELFFEDHSETVIQDDKFVRLQTFPNVLITAHQAFFYQRSNFKYSRNNFSKTLICFSKMVKVRTRFYQKKHQRLKLD